MKFGGALDELRDNTKGLGSRSAISPVLPPRLAVLEMGLLIALIIAEYSVDGFPALTRFNPHPYWIAVLLLSLQYGTVSGLMAAGIAIIGTVLIGMPEPDIEERYFNYLIRVWTQPVLWLLVAMLLGTFRARQIEQRDDLLLQVDNLKARGTTLLDHTTNLRARCAMLERHIATRDPADAGHLLAALGRLGAAEPGRWVPALRAALDAGFPGAQLSLYAIDGARARHVLTHGAAMAGPPPQEIDAGSPLFVALVGEGRALSVLDAANDTVLNGHGVVAVPVFADAAATAEQPRRVIGLLKADVLAPSQLDASTPRRLAVIAGQLAPALQQGRVTAVSGGGSLSAVTTNPDEAIPTVRRWRLLRGLLGGKPAGNEPQGGSHG
jgi:hypothetical protein